MTDHWQYSIVHNSPCKVIEEQTFWGQTVCRVWLPNQDAVVRVPRSALRPLNADLEPEIEVGRIAYVAAAAKVAEVLEGSTSATDSHVLLAPMESNVIPLPHQIHALSRAISGDRVRYLLADEVGLGKTIEAGLVMRELKLRGLVRRTLVVSPKGIATQWVSEMRTHFNENFQLVLGQDMESLRRISCAKSEVRSAEEPANHALRTPHYATRNPFHNFDQVIVSMDTFRPLDGKYSEASRSRFEDLITAGWDLVIVDEAHRLGGSTDQVACYKLGKGLAEASPYVLMLSATPHQGKTDAFHRLMNLLDDKTFPNIESVSRDRVAPYVIRTEKRKAIDADGKPLFKPRRTQMVPVAWESRHHLQQLLYEAVTDYVREGYNQALREKKRHIGFLMILMQRLVVSSTRAIRTTLERRLAVLEGTTNGHESTRMEDDELVSIGVHPWFSSEEWEDMDGQEQLDALSQFRLVAIENEKFEVHTLLDTAVRCEQAGPDAKAEALLERIYMLQAEENEPDLKVLIFTEFVPTQQMLKEFLEARGISVVTLNGSMDMEERKQAQDAFRKSHRVLVSTDAGGEGLNLQFAHVIINYDIPWNPMRLEQRIGRVDRIGQPKTVQAINFVFEDSVEFRVREVLEQKLSVIFAEFGIDKTGDVLDSAQAGELFEDVFASAILNPDGIEASVDNTVAQIRDEIQQVREASAIYGISEEPDLQAAERLRSHPLPHWVERMTVGYLNSHGGTAIRKRSWWDLNSLVHRGNNFHHQGQLRGMGDTLNKTFAGWLGAHYASLINLPPTNPAMVHHVPRRLARTMEDSGNACVALIVVDGLALDQWVTVRQFLLEQDTNLVMRESATFAWIPTLTSVSRQSIFSGTPPLYFPSSINSTNSEENLWKKFWDGHGLSRLDVEYQRGLGDGNASSALDTNIHPGRTRVVGLVIDKVDKIMHGMQLGSAGMHNQIKQWCQGGFLGALIGQLLDYGYVVWLTADHGNIECEGKGRPSEGVIAETRGERVRIYPTPELRSQVAGSFLFAQKWQPVGLPENYFPLIAGGRNAFINDGNIIVGHGGIAIEEVIVPLVKFERRTR